jgi:hypothetical protein
MTAMTCVVSVVLEKLVSVAPTKWWPATIQEKFWSWKPAAALTIRSEVVMSGACAGTPERRLGWPRRAASTAALASAWEALLLFARN